MKIDVVVGNIVGQPDAHAVVNSANANLRFGSGVAGAIHGAAGPELEAYCRPFAPLALGSALVTPGFGLPNPWIVHVRAPHYLNDQEPEQVYERAIVSMIEAIRIHRITSVAIPAIGTGVFRFPAPLAASIMARVLAGAASTTPELQWARICVVNQELRAAYGCAFEALRRRDL